jgi:glycosyltransferase involved in cell wall biosynthesis
VATQVGGMSECVVDGETGLLVAPDDEDALTNATRRLLDNEEVRRQMGRKAKAWIVNHFAMNQIAHQYESFYAQMLEEARGRRVSREN